MQGFETIINSIIKLGIAMLVGFVCIKTGYITKEQNNGLSKVIVRVTLPILIITSLTSLEFDTQKLKNSIYVLLVSIVVVAFLFAVGTVTSKIPAHVNAGRRNKSEPAGLDCGYSRSDAKGCSLPTVKEQPEASSYYGYGEEKN